MEVDYKNFKGFLKKKASSMFLGWQKRYFQVLDGKMIIYSTNENDLNPKGHFLVSYISKATSVDKKVFAFNYNQRKFELQANDEESKEQWISVINHIVDDYQSTSPSAPVISEDSTSKKEKLHNEHKLEKNLDKKAFDLLRNHGFLKTEVNKLSNDLLIKKGIPKLLNVKDPRVLERIHYGFLFKYKDDDKSKYFEYKWFFILSQRPLLSSRYDLEDNSNEEIKEKDWLKFNCLFNFHLRDDDSGRETIDLAILNKIELVDAEEKFFLVLNNNEEHITLCSDLKAERDKWNEVLSNARRTIREYEISMTKHPKNTAYLSQLLAHRGMNKLKEKLSEEKSKLIGDLFKITNYEALSIVFSKLKYEIESVIDGCICSDSPQIDLLKAYTSNLFLTVLTLYQKFWEIKQKEIEPITLIKLASDLYSLESGLREFLVVDTNFSKNANAFVDLFMSRQYKALIDAMAVLLKKDCLKKKIKTDKGYLTTKSSALLMQLLLKLSAALKPYQHEYIISQQLVTVKECLIQYFIVIDSLATNHLLFIKDDFLIALTNNCQRIKEEVSEGILVKLKKSKCFEQDWIDKAVKWEKMTNIINVVILNCLSRFANTVYMSLSEAYEDDFFCLDIKMITNASLDIFEHFSAKMNETIRAICIETFIQFNLLYYLKALLSLEKSKLLKKEDLINKLIKDKDFLLKRYEKIIDKVRIEDYFCILSGIITFLQKDINSISSSFAFFKEYIGPSFGMIVVHGLLRLRNDVTAKEIKLAANQCREIQLADEETSSAVAKKPIGKDIFFQLFTDMKIEGDECLVRKVSEKDIKKGFVMMTSISKALSKIDVDEDNLINPKQAKKEWEELKDVEESFKGMLMMKAMGKWEPFFFQLKKSCLYWFPNKTTKAFCGKITMKTVTKIKLKDDLLFSLIEANRSQKSSEYKAVKLKAESKEAKDQWIEKLQGELVIYQSKVRTNVNLVEITRRKKMIIDPFKQPRIGKTRNELKVTVNSYITQENCFSLMQKTKSIAMNEPVKKESKAIDNSIYQRTIKIIESTNKEYLPKMLEHCKSGLSKASLFLRNQKTNDLLILIGFILILILALIYS